MENFVYGTLKQVILLAIPLSLMAISALYPALHLAKIKHLSPQEVKIKIFDFGMSRQELL